MKAEEEKEEARMNKMEGALNVVTVAKAIYHNPH